MDQNPTSVSSLSRTKSTQLDDSDEEIVLGQSSLKESLSTHLLSGTSLPIRAPLSSDFDVKINGGHKLISDNSSSYSSMSSNNSVSDYEQGFLSGEEDFETASERPFIADPNEETLGIVMEREKTAQPVVVASSNFSSAETFVPPKAHLSGDDDGVPDEGFVSEVDDDDDGSSAAVATQSSPLVGTFVPPKAHVSRDDDDVVVAPAEVFVIEADDVDDGSPRVAKVPVVSASEPSEVAVDDAPQDSEVIENPSLVKEDADKVLVSENKEPSFENNSVLGLGTAEFDGNGVTGTILVPGEALVVKEEDTLPEKLKSDEVAVSAVTLPEEETENGDEVVVEKKKDVEDEVVETKVPLEVNAVSAVTVPEEETENGDEVVVEKKKEVEDEVVETKVPLEVNENGVSEEEVEVPVQESGTLESKDDQITPETDDLVNSDIEVKDRDIDSSKAVDMVVEPIQVELESNDGVVEEEKVPETENGEILVEKSVSSESVEKIMLEEPVESKLAEVVEEPVESKLVEVVEEPIEPKAVKVVEEPVEQKEVEVFEEPAEPKLVLGDEPVPVRSGEEDTNVAFTNAQSSLEKGQDKDGDDDEKSAGNVDRSISVDQVNPGTETDSGAKPNEAMLNLVGNGVHPDSENGLPVESDLVQKEESAVVIEDSKHVEDNEDVVTSLDDESKNVISSQSPENAVPVSILDKEVKQEADDEVDPEPDFEMEDEDEGTVSDEGTEGLNFDGSLTAEQIMKELERGSHSGGESSQDHFQRVDGQIVMDSDEEVDTDEEGDGKELFDSAALAALLKAATSAGSDGGNVTITSSDGSRLFSVERPAGLGSSIRSLKPAQRSNRPNLFTSSDLTVGGETENELSEEEKKKLEKIQLLRVKFLRLVQRLGYSPEDTIAEQVLYRLRLASGRLTTQTFSLDTARRTAMQLEAEGKEDLDFSLNILVLGKTGVGKSATINSIFGEEKAHVDPFEPGTAEVKEIMGMVDGVKVRVFDTPGLRSSIMEQAFNQKVLSSVKKFTKKNPPDILLYVDRLDSQTRDLNDMPLLRSITATLGSSIWRSAIVTLTHAGTAPPDGPAGSPLSYEMFVGQRSHVVQQSIGQAVGDLRMMNPSLMNPVSLVENHPACRRNREGHRVLPNGQSWKPQLLLLCYSMKILAEASSLSKPQDPFDHRKLFGFRVRSPPLPYLLSSLLQSRPHPKLPNDQGAEVDSDIDLGDLSESDQEEEEDEYDQLPPFKPLRKAQIAKLSKEQRKAYFDEYDYRVKLLQKKQLKDELKRMREMKKGKDNKDEFGFMGEDGDQENGGPAAVPVPLPDMTLPPSFDGDNPGHRYRFLEPTSQLLARPVLDTHGWDHDCGYDGVSLEDSLAIIGKFPAGVAVQITKDKKEFNIHLDSSVSTKHGENGSTMAGFDIQTIGKQLAYIVRGETKFKNMKKNKTAAGVSLTFLGETMATGLKVEDQIALGKRLVLVGSTGTVRSQGDAAYGANLEVRLKDKEFPIEQDQSTLGLSLMKWRGDLAVGANLQSQISIGRSSKVSVRVGLNNKLSGQITIRTSSSEQLQLALVGLLPIALSIYRTIFPGVAGESYPTY